MTLLNDILETAKTAAIAAGKKALEIKNSPDFSIASKSDNSQVTAGDLAAEATVKAIILKSFPEHMILSEESASDWKDSDYMANHLWIVDPIDGTTNYVYGIPHSAVSIAYSEQGQVKCAVVYNFFNGEIFYASLGSGAYLNGAPIRHNQIEVLQEALVATGLPYIRPVSEQFSARITNISNRCRDLRRLAAASLDLCYVACGRLDAYYETVQSWDMAAGGLIAREAGCKVVNISERSESIPSDLNGFDLLASCPAICDELNKLLNQ